MNKQGLKGHITIEVRTENQIKVHEIKGEKFSWEDGGDYNASFLFKFFNENEEENIPVIEIAFSTDGNELLGWNISVHSDMTIIEDKLSPPDWCFNYDPEEHD
jgi:hypothetical protein